MFKKRLFKVVKSDEGFSVKTLGRTGIRYTEKTKSMFIDSEFMATTNPIVIVILKNSIKTWNPPHSSEEINDAKREIIIDNVSRALRFRGIEVEVA